MFIKNHRGNVVNTSKIVAVKIDRKSQRINMYISPSVDDTVGFDFQDQDAFEKAIKTLDEMLTCEHIRWIGVDEYQFRADKVIKTHMTLDAFVIDTDVGQFYLNKKYFEDRNACKDEFNQSLADAFCLIDMYK